MVRKVLAPGLTACAMLSAPAFAQQADTPKVSPREEVNAKYAKSLHELDSQHLTELAKVAAGEKDEAADATYRLLFNLAIARNQYEPVEKAAEAVIASGTHAPDVEMLAQFVNVVAEADRGDIDESLRHLEAYVKPREGTNDPRLQISSETVLAVGEAYFQRLVQSGHYHAAKEFCEFAIANTSHAELKNHFTKRLARIALLGTQAPALAGTDVDGKTIALADLKGKVVLVDFWATWCPPCSAQMVRLNMARERFKDQGFEVLGVNVDAMRAGVGKVDEILPTVRRYILDHQATFPSIVASPEQNLAQLFGVDEIPANFLIDRDGKIVQFELGDKNGLKAIETALGKK